MKYKLRKSNQTLRTLKGNSYYHSYKEHGLSTVENILLLFVAAIILIGLVKLLAFSYPDLADKAIMLALVSAGIGAVAWSFKQVASSLQRRTKVLILEYLSDNKPHKRKDIRGFLKWKSFGLFYWDALADLVLEEKVILEDGMYKLPVSNNKELE
jgi:hypothetical protein